VAQVVALLQGGGLGALTAAGGAHKDDLHRHLTIQ
jgi:hypothetical protein